MRVKMIRRLFMIRLALSFVWDYWKISRLNNKLTGERLEAAVNQVYANAGKRMKHTAFRLKGILVKAGQFLSMREDVLPKAFTRELADLQDALPPAPFATVKPILEREFGWKLEAIFLRFDEEVVGAASLAQVYKAVLMDGTEVAVKVLRPRMEQLANADLDTLGLIAKVTQRIPALTRKMNFVQLHKEFTETIHRELDCHKELIHLQRFERMFLGNEHITVPKAYEDYTTRQVLVMDFVEGARVTDKRELQAWGVDGKSLAKALLGSYLQQILVHGFIHVDPHPGNLLVLPDNRLCFIDFGMIDELSKEEVNILRGLLRSIMMGDQDAILTALEQLGFIPANANRDAFRPLVHHLLYQFSGDESDDHQGMDAAGFRSFMHNSPIQLQAKYMFLLRCLGLLKSVLAVLAPSTDWFELLFQVGPSIISKPIEIK